MNQSKTSTPTQAASEWGMLSIALIKGLVISFFALQLLLIVASIGISHGSIGEEQMSGAVVASVFLAAFCGGGYTLSKTGKKGLFVGLLQGALLFLLLCLLGFTIYPQTSMANGGLGILFACLSGGAVAKFLVKKKKKIIKNTKKS